MVWFYKTLEEKIREDRKTLNELLGFFKEDTFTRESDTGGFLKNDWKKGLISTHSKKAISKPLYKAIFPEPSEKQMSLDSIDIRFSDKIYELEAQITQLNKDTIKKYGKPVKTEREPVLEPGKTYLIKSCEKFDIPKGYIVKSDTRSTVARLGGAAQLVGKERQAMINSKDTKEGGGKQQWIQVTPKQFPLVLTPQDPESAFIQIRFEEENHENDVLTPEEIFEKYGNNIMVKEKGKEIPLKSAVEKGNLYINKHTDKIYKAKDKDLPPIDITKKNFYNPNEYFEEICGDKDGDVILEKDILYLFGTKESIKLGGGLCGEILRENRYLGRDIPIHEAGFIGANWEGPLTLEIIPHGNPVLNEGYAGQINIEKIKGRKENEETEEKVSSYLGQESPALPKVFEK